MMPKLNILIVEDEPQIRRFVGLALSDEGHAPQEAATAREGLIAAATRKPDLVVLDLGLPDMDGVDFIRDLRGWSSVPVLILSARTDEADKIEALDAGADDYLVKPFGVGELMARVRALTRRRSGTDAEEPIFRFDGVEIDFASRLVTRNGEPVHLTRIEYRLLSCLAAHPGKVQTHRQLMRDVWGPGQGDNTHYLRIYMSHLRQKLETDPAQPAHFLTELGIGYRFEP